MNAVSPAGAMRKQSDPVEPSLVYRTDLIEVLRRAGATDYLVISFATKNEVANGSSYWLKSVADKAGLSMIGFMPRGPNWYPQKDVVAAIEVLRGELAAFKKIIVIGTSMGGYAALKYSARLGASHVLSFAPQFSIDPKDVGDFDKRFLSSFKEHLNADMAIAPSDVGGDAYVFYDPYYTEDTENVRRICRNVPGITAIGLPRTIHFPITLFRGTQAVTDLIDMCLAGDDDGILTIARRRRRTANVRIATTCSTYARKNPERAKALFDKRLAQFDAREISDVYLLIARLAQEKSMNVFAEDVVIALLASAPDNPAALLMYGKMHLARKALPEALAQAHKMTQTHPQDASTLNEAALLMFQAGALEDAEATFKAALAIVPEKSGLLEPGIWRRLSAVYVQKGEADKALAPAQKAIELAPRVAAYHAHLASVWLSLGRHAEARDAASAAITLDPHDKNAAHRLEKAERWLAENPDAAMTTSAGKARRMNRAMSAPRAAAGKISRKRR